MRAAPTELRACRARSALVTIEMLKELERQTGQRVHDLFDVIAGTSTGGILAAGIQERLTLEELETLYLELSKLVFTKEPGPRRGFQLLLTGATYKAARLEAVLKRVLPRLTRAEEVAATLAFGAGAGGASCEETLSMLDRRAVQEVMYTAQRAAERAPGRSRSPSPPPPSAGADGNGTESVEEVARGWSDPPTPPTPPPPRPPHLLIVACLSSRAPPVPYIFRNYEYPTEDAGSASTALERHAGTSAIPLWQALRATTAAPSYFAGLELRGATTPDMDGATQPTHHSASGGASGSASGTSFDGGGAPTAATHGHSALDADHPPPAGEPEPRERNVFQDGGLLANNPAAVALHEARLLFPHAPIACLASFGTGLFPPETTRRPNSWSSVFTTLVRAATRTEEVHQMLSELLPVLRVPYYRFNPRVPTGPLDETAPQKLAELQQIGRAHVLTGNGRDDCAALAKLLTTGRGRAGLSAPAVAAQRLRAWPAALLLRIGQGIGTRVGRPRL
jgi:hypothetical protein